MRIDLSAVNQRHSPSICWNGEAGLGQTRMPAASARIPGIGFILTRRKGYCFEKRTRLLPAVSFFPDGCFFFSAGAFCFLGAGVVFAAGAVGCFFCFFVFAAGFFVVFDVFPDCPEDLEPDESPA